MKYGLLFIENKKMEVCYFEGFLCGVIERLYVRNFIFI